MSKYSLKRGTATNVGTSQIVSGGKNVSTTTIKEFRIDGKAISFSGGANITDGDDIEVSGKDSGGEFKAIILVNHTTGAKYGEAKNWLWVVCIGLVIFGALTSVVLIGLPILFGGLYLSWVQYEAKKAEDALAQKSLSGV